MSPVLRALPGSTRSGENATNTSRSSASPVLVARSSTMSSVVPGYVVDSSDTSVPGVITRATVSAAASM